MRRKAEVQPKPKWENQREDFFLRKFFIYEQIYAGNRARDLDALCHHPVQPSDL